MKKKIALLLAGAMALAIVLSACSSAGTEADPDPAVTQESAVPTQPEERDAVPTSGGEPSAQVSGADPEPPEEPSLEVEGTAAPAVTSAPPTEASQAPAVVSTPKPVENTPAPVVSTPAPAEPEPAVVDAPVATDAPDPAAEPSPEPTQEAAPEPDPAATKADASAFIGQSASSMIAAIGQPLSRSYAPSCLGDGEDGELIYSGFTVYTYREGDTETVQDVL